MKKQLVYLGIDIAKSYLDAAVGSEERRFSNDTIGHRELIKWVKQVKAPVQVISAVCAIPFALAQPTSCSVSAGCRNIVTTPPTVFEVNVSERVDPATVQPSDFMCNGLPADSATVTNGNLTIEFVFNTSPAVPGVNTIHIPAGAFDCGPVVDFTCTFRFNTPRATPTPRPRPTPVPRGPFPTPASI